MARLLPIYAGILLSTLLVRPVLAQEDQIIDVKPCPFFCKLWRNVSRNAQVSASAPVGNGSMPDERTLAQDEGAHPPRTSQLVAEPGSIIVETAADRARRKQQKAKLEREIAVPGNNAGQGQAAKAHK
jgi:hypothetical protein